MARRALLIALATTLALGGAAACGGGTEEPTQTEIVGIITEVSRSGGRIDAITIRSNGDMQRVELDPTIDYGFDLEHLEEHRRQGDPVRCHVASRGDRAIATVILDA